MQRNARFWVYVNGDAVKLTLSHGQTLRHLECGYTEEGYKSAHTTWTLGDDAVYREYDVRESDCDGRHHVCSEDYCPLDQLAVNEPYGIELDSGLFPQWEAMNQDNWDQYAELMNY